MSIALSIISVLVVLVLLVILVASLFNAFFDMDTDPHDELVVDYEDPYCPSVRELPSAKYHVAARVREISEVLAKLPENAEEAEPFIEEISRLQIAAVDAGWITEEAIVNALFSDDVFSDDNAGYLAMLAWFADTIDPASSAKVAA